MKFSAWFYEMLLVVYPASFRHRFGGEMMEAFAEDLSETWRREGPYGAGRVWCSAVAEIGTVALPLRLTDRSLLVPVLSLCVHVVLITGFLMLTSSAGHAPFGFFHGAIDLTVHPHK